MASRAASARSGLIMPAGWAWSDGRRDPRSREDL